nr:hypothetical protein [Halorientalis sp.]
MEAAATTEVRFFGSASGSRFSNATTSTTSILTGEKGRVPTATDDSPSTTMNNE